MKRLAILAVLPLLASCAGMPAIDACKYSEARRALYRATIAAADAWALSGRPMPAELSLSRAAAVVALETVNRNCPVPAGLNSL